MKAKCEPGDKLKFPNGTEWLFVRYIDEGAILASYHGEPDVRVVCKCCTPKLTELLVKPDQHSLF